MTKDRSGRARLEERTLAFIEAFNREDLDAVMAFIAADAIYDQFNGQVSRGKDAIRAAFVPQFRGDYGTMRFVIEDLLIDTDAGSTLIRWLCTLEREDRPPRGWRGLDLLRFRDGLVTEKHTYAKAELPLLHVLS
jgi:ketosteroid isomerase-like protein